MSRLVSTLRRWLEPLGTGLPESYLVGGAVRDHLLGHESKDIDLMCAEPQALARALESVHDITLVPFLNKPDTPCLRAVNRADSEDFLDLVPIHGSGVEDDLGRRDFTINAMAIALGASGALGELIDPLGGRRDLRERLIRAAGPDSMTSDPLRVIRAARFSAELGFEIDAATRQLMTEAADRLAAVAAERIVRELFLTLKQPASAPLIRMLDGTGALQAIFPEIARMRGCSQNEHHHLDVWDHSLEALEKLEGILSSLADQFEPVAGRLRTNLEQENRLAVLKLAMLLHDAGKPETRSVDLETGRVTFHGHDAAGAMIAEQIAARLKFSARDQELFRRLIADHMHMIGLSGPDVRPGTILRWFRRLGEDMVLLLLLGMADVMATAGPASNEVERERHLRWCRETIRSYYDEIKDRLERKPLIGGRDLMAIGILPGPRMGEILEAIRAAQDEGAVRNRDEALALAAELTRKPEIEILDDPDSVARRAAGIIAAAAREAVAARGRFVLAVSGGRTPWAMLRALAGERVPWEKVHVIQVDERAAPEGHADRNLTHLRTSLLAHAPLPPDHIHAMPVEAPDLEAAARQYARTLQKIAGSPPVPDLVHLGLGPDGHTASLVPGDPAIEVADADVAVTAVYLGRRRMTLTYPILNRSRQMLWVVTGSEKAAMLARLLAGDRSIPAGRVRRNQALVIADRAAAAASASIPHK